MGSSGVVALDPCTDSSNASHVPMKQESNSEASTTPQTSRIPVAHHPSALQHALIAVRRVVIRWARAI